MCVCSSRSRERAASVSWNRSLCQPRLTGLSCVRVKERLDSITERTEATACTTFALL